MRGLDFVLLLKTLGAEIVDGYIMAGDRRHGRIYRDDLFLEDRMTVIPLEYLSGITAR